MLLNRILTALVLAPLVALLLMEGGRVGTSALFVVAGAICAWEMFTMVMPGRRFERLAGVAMVVLAMVIVAASGRRGDPFYEAGLIALVAVLIPSLAVLARPDPIEGALLRLVTLWSGFVYLVIPLALGLDIAGYWQEVGCILVIVFAGDTGAYFVGKGLGRHRLYPRVSPNKTIEGAFGGLAASGLVGLALIPLADSGVTALGAILLGVGGGFVAQIGDLVESLLKRSAGVKDSGSILPGHGGLLDRIDGVIFAFVFYYAAW